MFIPVDDPCLREQDFDRALWLACEKLSATGVSNNIDYNSSPRVVDVFDPSHRQYTPIVDFRQGGIELVDYQDNASCPISPQP